MTGKFFSRLRQNSPAPDASHVAAAACYLEVGEFRLFEMAWEDWHGEMPDEKTVERHFVRYLFHQTVPIWVRHFVRKVLARARDAGFAYLERNLPALSKGWWKANEVDLLITALIVVGFAIVLRLGIG